MEYLAVQEIPKVEMSFSELEKKEIFRRYLESVMQKKFAEHYPEDIATISLVGFGSLASGFGMPGSDMDLALMPQWKDPSKSHDAGIDRNIPRLLERAVLDVKMGGRLLTRTRVPILKICQSPTETLYTALFEERKKWDELPEEEKYPVEPASEPTVAPKSLDLADVGKSMQVATESPKLTENFPALGTTAPGGTSRTKAATKSSTPSDAVKAATPSSSEKTKPTNKDQQTRPENKWMREKVIGPLDFPKTGVGIQCDVNFDNPLGIHNTHLLRCYSMADPRVRPIILFVKAWAKRRKINSSYSGTLSSYGWVLMVLHYLVNVAQPRVCPNLQLSAPNPTNLASLQDAFQGTMVGGYNVRFWDNEKEIHEAAQAGQLSQNRQSVGALLRGFFQYFASSGYEYGVRPPQFYWTTEVLSLRTPGGIQTKQAKGWVSATTKITAEKKVTNRYLFAIEDPFEIDHNVARTVTHRGIVAIRDEFRRTWRILRAIGQGAQPEGGIFDEVIEEGPPTPKAEVKDEPKTVAGNDSSGAATQGT